MFHPNHTRLTELYLFVDISILRSKLLTDQKTEWALRRLDILYCGARREVFSGGWAIERFRGALMDRFYLDRFNVI